MAGDVESLTQEKATRSPIVETASGKVQGLTSHGVHVFKGIPYGASTAGANRFMPPRKPEPWTGVREAVAYAGRSPQAPGARSGRSSRPCGARSIPCRWERIA